MSHTKKHGIDSNTDHDGVSGATTGNLVQFDASGLPADSNKKEGDFLLIDGTRAMTGNIQLNGNYLSNDGDNEGIVIDSSGNVGIGTNTPGGKLDITETTGADATMNLQAGEASNAILQIVADDGDDDADKYRLISKSDNNFQIESYAPGSWTSRLAIDSSGKIGLNESSPNSAIDIDEFQTKNRTFGGVRCFHAKINGSEGAIVLPLRSHYSNVLEFISPHFLRDKLKLKDGDEVKIVIYFDK